MRKRNSNIVKWKIVSQTKGICLMRNGTNSTLNRKKKKKQSSKYRRKKKEQKVEKDMNRRGESRILQNTFGERKETRINFSFFLG
jgi:hypothetical protein